MMLEQAAGATKVAGGTLRGEAIRSVLMAIEHLAGKAGLAAVEGALDASTRAAIGALVPNDEYPVALSAALHRAVQEALGKGELTWNYRIGVEAARIDFPGVFRAVLWTLDYETVLQKLTEAWPRFNSLGRVEWLLIEEGHATGRIVGVEGFTRPMWAAVAGRVDGLLRLCGASNAHVEVAEWSDAAAQFEIRWSP